MPRRSSITVALLVVVALLGVITLPGERPAQADATQYAQISGTDIGIFFRADENNWESRRDFAGSDGELVKLKCAMTGMPVGQYGNRTWYEASTSGGEGKLPDAFLNTPVKANERPPGVPECGEQAPDKPEPKPERPPGPVITSVFFSPEVHPQGLEDISSVAQLDLPLGDWKSDTQCSDDTTAKRVPETATILSAWSLGRLAVIYSLNQMGEERANRITDIILFDPGNMSDFAPGDEVTCDWRYDINGILAKWLEAKDYHRLFIMSGYTTKEGTDRNPQTDFAGLWKYYLAGVWNKDAGKRVTVCHYDGMDHEEVLRRFASMADNVPNTCPSGPRLTVWHPAS